MEAGNEPLGAYLGVLDCFRGLWSLPVEPPGSRLALDPITNNRQRVEAMRSVERQIDHLRAKIAELTRGHATELSSNGVALLRRELMREEQKFDALARMLLKPERKS